MSTTREAPQGTREAPPTMATCGSPTQSTLEDDWEEVADNYSIVSLHSSDDEQDAAPAASSSASPPPKDPPSYSDSRSEQNHDAPSSPLQTNRRPGSRRVVDTPSHPNYTHRSPSWRFDASSHTSNPSDNDTGPAPIFDGPPMITDFTNRRTFDPYCSPRGQAMEVSKTVIHHPTPSHEATDRGARILDLLGAPLRRPYHQDSSSQAPDQTNMDFGNQTCGPAVLRGTEKPARDLDDQSFGRSWPSKWNDVKESLRDIEHTTGDSLGKTKEASVSEDAEPSSKQGRTLGETLDLDDSEVDPVSIYKTLQSLGDYLLETSNRTVKELAGCGKEVDIANRCQRLLAQVNELRPILAEYASQSQQPTGAARDIPLDPSLTLWMSSLRAVLTKLRKKCKLWSSYSHGPEERRAQSSLTRLVTALSNHNEQMDDFLPIIQVDFNDYRTKNISFPTQEIDDAGRVLRRGGNIPPRSSEHLTQVRKSLYSLKDQIEQIIQVLAVAQPFIPQATSNTVSDVVRSLGTIFNATSLALTNNGSEWLESDLGRAQMGLLSHAEFSNLDPTTLHEFAVRFKQISDLLSSDPADRWTDDMIRRHYICMLVDQHQLDALANISSVLEDMMMPNHMKTRTEFEDFLKEM